jgi:allophanate hydrolase subunit 2
MLRRGSVPLELATLRGRALPPDHLREPPSVVDAPIRVLPGPHHERVPGALEHLLAGRFTVDPRSDRVGVRLRWQRGATGEGARGTGELLSEGVPRGAVQVPPDGAPIILLADHQTTGGYPIPAVVIASDWWRIGQLRPGEALRLRLVSPEEALAAWRARQAWLHAVAEHCAGHARRHTAAGAIDPEHLMRGFSEWSEEASDV